MRCKTCEYALWNLRSRTCPECGAPFAPSDYQFRPGTVRFCCPHCAQEYYGTGEKGHLEPSTFDCVKCAARIHMNEMVLLPAEGISEDQTQGEVMPWLERGRIGFRRAWFRMIKMGLIKPGRLLELTPLNTTTGKAMGFACFTQAIFGVTGFVGIPCGVCLFAPVMGARGGAVALSLSVVAGVIIGFFLVMGVTFVAIWVWALLAHGLLRLTGPTQGGVDRTVHALALTSGANALSGIPCLGLYFSYFFSIWWLVSATIGLRSAQKVSGGRAAFATLTPPLTLAALGIATYLVLIIGVVQTAATSGPIWIPPPQPMTGTVQAQASSLQRVLMAEAAGGQWPRTGLHLLVEEKVQYQEFVFNLDGTRDPYSVKHEGLPLVDFPMLNAEQKRLILEAAASKVTDKTIASRVGDVVFLYHGVPVGKVDPRLWLFVGCPLEGSMSDAMVIDDLGRTRVVSGEARARALAEQNQVRAELGLLPIPEPKDVIDVFDAADEPATPQTPGG